MFQILILYVDYFGHDYEFDYDFRGYGSMILYYDPSISYPPIFW